MRVYFYPNTRFSNKKRWKTIILAIRPAYLCSFLFFSCFFVSFLFQRREHTLCRIIKNSYKNTVGKYNPEMHKKADADPPLHVVAASFFRSVFHRQYFWFRSWLLCFMCTIHAGALWIQHMTPLDASFCLREDSRCIWLTHALTKPKGPFWLPFHHTLDVLAHAAAPWPANPPSPTHHAPDLIKSIWKWSADLVPKSVCKIADHFLCS